MGARRRAVSLFLMVVLLLGSLWLVSSGLSAQDQPAQLDGPAVVRLYFRDRAHLDAVAGKLDIWEVQPQKGFAVAALKPADYEWLRGLGYRLEIDAVRTSALLSTAALDPRYYYYDDFFPNSNGRYAVDFLQRTNTTYGHLTELTDIGNAWMAGQMGEYDRDIWVLRITNEDPSFGAIEDKPVFFLFAGIHAREVAIPELAIRYISYLTAGYDGEGGYGLDPDVTWLVDHNVIYVLVMQNPDGHWKNEQNAGNYRRKNMDWDDGCSIASSWGVDLNRNHSFLWGCCNGSSGSACDETYRGPARGSEPETQAFEAFFASVMRDQNGANGNDEIPAAAPDDTTGIFISLHSYSDLVLWPWGFSDYGDPPNYAQLRTIGRKFAYYNGYDASGTIWYSVDGATDDWTYGRFGVASYTFEVGPEYGACGDFFPAYGCIDGIDGMSRNFWAENKPALLYAHKIARSPYLTAYGPDAEQVTALPAAVMPGGLLDLTAIIADHRLGSDPLQPVVAAEYFVDAPGQDGSGTPLAAGDGAWGGTSEAVQAVVDISGLSLGRHYLLVHGQNQDGDWGPLTAVFVYIVDPALSPVIEGHVRTAGSQAPLEATVTANAFQAHSDPATGYYSMTVVSGTYQMSAIAPGHVISTVTDVVVADHQTVQQDFELQPVCEIVADDVESGNLGWSAQSPWAITDEAAHSPTHSWTESPGGNYANRSDISLTSPAYDLSGYEDVTLSFWHTYDLETGWDYGYVEVSVGGGAWTQVAAYTGYDHTTWTQVEIPLPGLAGQDEARVRFRFYSDSSYTVDGWHLDDIVLAGSGPACTPQPPLAAFSSNSPVVLGQPILLTNQTSGAPPLTYHWDLGDGLGTSAARDLAYTYLSTGTFAVTLTVTNSIAADSVSHSVVVQPCIALTGITIHGPLGGWPGSFDFTTTYTPAGASAPLAYAWDNGDATTLSTRSLASGSHTLTVTATNCTAALVTDTHQITIVRLYDIYLPLLLQED